MSAAPSRGSGRAPGTAAPPAACAGARPAPPGSAAATRAAGGRAARRRRETAARRRPTRALPRPTAPAAAPRPAPSARRCGGAAAAARLRPDASAARSDTAARRAPARSRPDRSGAMRWRWLRHHRDRDEVLWMLLPLPGLPFSSRTGCPVGHEGCRPFIQPGPLGFQVWSNQGSSGHAAHAAESQMVRTGGDFTFARVPTI